MVKVNVNPEKCIGCEACVGVCDNFEMVDGKAVPKSSEVNDAGCNTEAKEICPVDAISVG